MSAMETTIVRIRPMNSTVKPVSYACPYDSIMFYCVFFFISERNYEVPRPITAKRCHTMENVCKFKKIRVKIWASAAFGERAKT